MIVMQMINTFLGLLLLIARSDHGKIKREENENKCFASDSFFLIHVNSRYIEWKWNQFVFSSIYVHFTANPLIPHPLFPMHTHTLILSHFLSHTDTHTITVYVISSKHTNSTSQMMSCRLLTHF